jgi:putative colanic acid biosynthesis acetyltransferase WcaF
VSRYLWGWVWLILFRPSPFFAYAWRRLLLRIFGAKIGAKAIIHRTAKIWAPWNLEMAPYSCIGEYVDCYSGAVVTLGYRAVVSQYCVLCSASHDYEADGMPGVQRPIKIDDYAWIAARVYVGPGVTIGKGAVVGATASVYKNVEPWTVVGGNPAKVLKERQWRPEYSETNIATNSLVASSSRSNRNIPKK